MKRLIFILFLFAGISAFAVKGDGKLAVGDKAELTDAKMTDVSGTKVSLRDVKQKNGVLVLFSSNTCPFVGKWEGRYPDLKKWADKHNFGMIVVNSNHTKRDGDDSFEQMKKHASAKGYNFHYALDENSLLANAFGGQTTPHAFLFNGNLELVYKGAIDDNYDNADKVQKAYVKEAMTNVASGKKVEVTETKPVGCSIKRKID